MDITVIVRALNEEPSIGRCLELVRAQRTDGLEVEVIVVDSGSRDRTAEIARAHGAAVLRISPAEFSFGGALNVGAASAGGALLVALSAHAFPLDDRWLARMAERLREPDVACACGDRFYPDGSPLQRAVRQDAELARAHPEWGYSNAAGGFRAELWRKRQFRTDLPGGEDREWARYWLEHGHVCVVDPGLVVDHDHTHDPVTSIYRRARREAEGFAMFLGPTAYGPPELIREWWSDLRFYSSPLRARASHRRAARLLGTYAGRRAAARRTRGS